jgi:hypothetical protein
MTRQRPEQIEDYFQSANASDKEMVSTTTQLLADVDKEVSTVSRTDNSQVSADTRQETFTTSKPANAPQNLTKKPIKHIEKKTHTYIYRKYTQSKFSKK